MLKQITKSVQEEIFPSERPEIKLMYNEDTESNYWEFNGTYLQYIWWRITVRYNNLKWKIINSVTQLKEDFNDFLDWLTCLLYF